MDPLVFGQIILSGFTHTLTMHLSHKFKTPIVYPPWSTVHLVTLPSGAKQLRAERRLHITKYTNRKHCKPCVTLAYESTDTYTPILRPKSVYKIVFLSDPTLSSIHKYNTYTVHFPKCSVRAYSFT